MTHPISQLITMHEAVVNAVVHADYSQRGAPIRISFFDDRVEIEKPGILLPGLTVEDMLQGVSKIPNHVIARVFRELDMIEQLGSGVRRMFKEAETLGLPQPEIIEVGMRVRFIVYLSESVTAEVSEGATEQVTEQVKSLLFCLKSQSLGRRDAMRCIGLNSQPTFVYDYIQPAIQAGFVEMTQPDSPKIPTHRQRTDCAEHRAGEMTSII